MRLEILFGQEHKVSQKVMDALKQQLHDRLSPIYSRFSLRIAKSTSSAVQVTGTKTDEEHKKVMSLIQSVWEDDSWLPE
jgi:DNA-damage-inducible protein I